MTQVQQLNKIYKLILNDFTSREPWNELDLILLDLRYRGYSFQFKRKNFKGLFKVKIKSRVAIQRFMKSEIKRAVDLQLYDYLKFLLAYRKENLSKFFKAKRIYLVYDSDYISVRKKVINVSYSNHPLINLRLEALFNRRLKHV